MKPYGIAQSYADTPSRDWNIEYPVPYASGLTYVASPVGELVIPVVELTVEAYSYIDSLGYCEAVPYVGSPDQVQRREDNLVFVQEVTGAANSAPVTELLTFVEETSILHSAENTLVFEQPTYAQTVDSLTFSDSATYVFDAENTITFAETGGVASQQASDLLRFVQVAFVKLADNTSSDLAFIIEATWQVAQSAETSNAFSQEVSWSRIRSTDGDQGLRFLELSTYSILRDTTPVGSGGSGVPSGGVIIPPPTDRIIEHVTIGGIQFQMIDGYDYETHFDNSKYLNRGSKIILNLGYKGAWSNMIKDLVGTQQTVTNLWVTPFDVYITDESSIDSDRVELVCYVLDYDTRGFI